MPNIALTFREEITRLSRREIRKELRALKRASAQFRKDIAGLKRRISELRAEAARLRRQVPKTVAPRGAEAEAGDFRFSVRGFRSNRKRLGLSAESFGALAGVSAQTIYNWERGTTRPTRQKLALLKALRGIGKKEASARLDQASQKRDTGRRKKA